MSCNSELDSRKREISALVDDVALGERHFRERYIELCDEGEWLQLRDIVARIERKLLAKQAADVCAEAAE